MIGSARQSIARPAKGKLDCFVASHSQNEARALRLVVAIKENFLIHTGCCNPSDIPRLSRSPPMKLLWRRIIRRLATPLHDFALLVGAIGAVFSAVYFVAPHAGRFFDVLSETIIGFDLAPYVEPISVPVRLLLSGLFGFLLLIVILLLRRSLSYRRRTRHIAEEFRECLRAHLKFVSDVNGIHAARTKDKRALLAAKFRDHSVFLCGRISEMFETLTQCKCHTTIKSLDTATGVVKTRARDVLMHNRDRSQADEGSTAFRSDDHTAFSSILINPNRYMFVSNHLLFQSLMRRYTNKNPDWRKFYRATVVVPITSKRKQSEINKESVIGFITVDSRHGHFTKRTSRLILSLFTELVFDSMVHLGWKGDDAS